MNTPSLEGFGTRHTFVLMSSLGMALAHMLRVDLSVAIVSMVNTTSSSDNESVAVCGGEEEDKDIFGVESQSGRRPGIARSCHCDQSMLINGSVACTFVALIPYAATLVSSISMSSNLDTLV